MIDKLVIFAIAFNVVASARAEEFQWKRETPSSQSFSEEKLERLKDGLAERGTKGLLVIRNDVVVYEWYSEDHGPDKPHFSASMAKALVGGISLAVAMSDGRIALDDPAAKYVRQWAGDPLKSKITIRQLGSHTSGLEDAEADGLPHEKLQGWKGAFWKRNDPPDDPFTISRDQAPVLFEPGTAFHYSNPGFAMLGYAITAALEDAPEEDLRTLLRNRVMRPIGVPDSGWSVGYGRTFHVDELPLVGTWGGGNFTARTTARIGRLILREGNWEGKQLISGDAVRETTRDGDMSDGMHGNGIGWFTNAGDTFKSLPRDAFFAEGAQEQILLLVPSLNLIFVRNGTQLIDATSKDEHIQLRESLLYKPLMDSMTR